MTPIFDGTVNSEGKLLLDKSESFRQHLAGLNGKRVQVTVEKIKHSRTIQQNKYYWSVVVKLISQHTGHDPEQVHELLKQIHSPKWHFQPQGAMYGGGVPTSTTKLDTLEFVEYTEKCRQWGAEVLGINLPLPNEVNL